MCGKRRLCGQAHVLHRCLPKEDEDSKASKERGAGFQVLTLMAPPSLLHLFIRLCLRYRGCQKYKNYLLSTTRMPGNGGLGGATSSSVESGRSSVDWDRPVVLFRISISRSVRGSSDWLENEKHLGSQKVTEHTQVLGGAEGRGNNASHQAEDQEPWTLCLELHGRGGVSSLV